MGDIYLDDLERELLRDACLDVRMTYYPSEYKAMQHLLKLGLVKRVNVGEFVATDEGRAWMYVEQPAAPAQPATGGGADASAFELFAKAQNSGNYEDMRAAMFALKVRLVESQHAEVLCVNHISELQAELADARARAAAAEAGDVDPFAAPNEVHATPYAALAFHVQCAMVAAMPEDTWMKGWTPGQIVNEMATRLDALQRFYDLMFSVDAISDTMQALADEEEWEAWAELGELRKAIEARQEAK